MPHMANFTIIATGAMSSMPLERTAATAIEAEVQMHALFCICGKHSHLEVWGPDGRFVSADRLRTLAMAERARATP